MRKTTETDLVRVCLTWLQLTHPTGVWWRANTGCHVVPATRNSARRYLRFGVPGMSDIQGVLNGYAVFIECKSATGQLSSPQKCFKFLVEQAKAKYILVRSLSDLEKEL